MKKLEDAAFEQDMPYALMFTYAWQDDSSGERFYEPCGSDKCTLTLRDYKSEGVTYEEAVLTIPKERFAKWKSVKLVHFIVNIIPQFQSFVSNDWEFESNGKMNSSLRKDESNREQFLSPLPSKGSH